MSCINISHPDFQALGKDSGLSPFEMELRVAAWQADNGGTTDFPTLKQLNAPKQTTVNWWEEPKFKERNPNFDHEAYINSVNKFGQNFEDIPEHLKPKYNAGEEGFQQKEEIAQSKASPKTIKKVREWLHRLGIDIIQFKKLGGINAIADILENVIKLSEGKEDVALTEEAFHFAVDIIELTNPALFKEMMNQIGKYNIYNSVKTLYGEDSDYQNPNGSLNIIKLKKEAIGKLLSEMYIHSEEGSTEHPELLQKAKTWWERILAFFGILNKKAGFNPFEKAVESFEDLTENGPPVKLLAQKIIDNLKEEPAKDGKQHFKNALQDTFNSGDYQAVVKFFYQQLTDTSAVGVSPYDGALNQLGGNEELARQIIALGSPYYQLSTEQKAKQQTISEKFDKKPSEFGVEKVEKEADVEFPEQDDINYYQKTVGDKTTKIRRVTDVVKANQSAETIARFENLSPMEKKINKAKAKYGTQFHKDAENIGRAATKDGYLLPFEEIDTLAIAPNLPIPAFQALVKYLIGYKENGEYIPGVMQTQFPEGTLFKFETIIYDEREKRDIAGTVDLMGITPEGKIIIYDWKTKFLNLSTYQDIPWFSQRDYKTQLSEYVRILESYDLKNVKDSRDIQIAQAMPIIFGSSVNKEKGDVVLTSITFPNANIKEENKRYLLPVPIDEQSSGNEGVDEYINILRRLHDTLYNQKDLNKALKYEQLNAISGAIRELQVKREFAPLAEQGLIFLKGAQRLLEDINKNLKNEKGEYVDVADRALLEEYRAKIKNISDNMHKYQDIGALFVDIYGMENLSDKDRDTLEKLKSLSFDSTIINNKIKAEYNGFIAHYYADKEGIDILKITKPIRGFFNRTIQSLSNMQNPALQYLRSVTSRANFNKQKKAIAKQEEYRTILNKFHELAKSKGLSNMEAFTLVAGKNSEGSVMNQLMDKIQSEFYTEFKKAHEKAIPNIEWLKDNIDLEKWQAEKNKDIERFNKQIDEGVYIIGDEEADGKEKERRKEDYKARFDISQNNSAGWLREDMKYYIKNEEKWETAEYKAMKSNRAALDMYEFIIQFNREAREIGYHDDSRTNLRFLPWLRASMLDRIRVSGLSAVKDSLEMAYTLTPEEEISYAKVNPATNQIDKRIPAFFTKNFAEPIKNSEGKTVSYNLKDVSTDIGETFPMYIEAVYEFESMSDIEGAVESVRDVENGKKAFLLDPKSGKIVHEGGKARTTDDNTENVALYDSFVEALLYKRQYNSDSSVSSRGTKLIEKANQFFRLKVFGFNIFTPITILVGGNFQGIINSRKLYRGKQFLKNETKIIGNLFTGNKGNIEKGLIDYVLPFTENRAKLNAERMSLDKIQRFSFSDFLMAPIRKSDVLIQMVASLSILENTILVDGELVNAREYLINSKEGKDRYKDPTGKALKEFEKGFEERVKALIEEKGIAKYAKFNEKGLLEIEGVDRNSETVHQLRLKILNEIRTITGNVSEENKIDADRNILLRSMMMFKRWIPPLVSNRFGGLQEKIDTGQYEMGRMRMVWQIVFNGDGGGIKGVIKGISNLKDMVSGTPKGIQLLAEYYQKTAKSYKDRTGNDLKMSPEEFYDMTRRAIMQQAKETAMLLGLIGSLIALRWAAPPKDDDSENKNIYRTTLKMLSQLESEISFYYNPLSLQQISTGSWLPSIGILTDGIKFATNLSKEGVGTILGDEDMMKSAHPIKTFFNMFPVSNAVMRTFIPLWSPETAKDLGVTVPSKFGVAH